MKCRSHSRGGLRLPERSNQINPMVTRRQYFASLLKLYGQDPRSGYVISTSTHDRSFTWKDDHHDTNLSDATQRSPLRETTAVLRDPQWWLQRPDESTTITQALIHFGCCLQVATTLYLQVLSTGGLYTRRHCCTLAALYRWPLQTTLKTI